MTDRALAGALLETITTEQLARAEWEAACKRVDDVERTAALGVMRQAIGLRTVLEQWITGRALRAAQQTEGAAHGGR